MISEEQRQALIAFNRAIIAQHEAYAVPESRWPDDVRMLVESARTALASLEAEKVELPTIFDAFKSQTGWQRGYVDGQTEYRHEMEGLGDLYTVPPVPVMKPAIMNLEDLAHRITYRLMDSGAVNPDVMDSSERWVVEQLRAAVGEDAA